MKVDLGLITLRLAVQDLEPPSTWTPPRYLGWAPIERIFVGIEDYRNRVSPGWCAIPSENGETRFLAFIRACFHIATHLQPLLVWAMAKISV
jgi:hypothetical protein